MRRFVGCALAVIAVAATSASAQDIGKKIEGGGISVAGWMGKVDAREAAAGLDVNSAKFAKMGDAFHVTTGPAITYWNPANKATGNYTVKATFTEPHFQNIAAHPHPYGIVIAGNDLGTENQSYLYCATYGTGSFIVRGFGPAPFQMYGRAGEANAAVKKATAKGEPVTQEIAMSVKGDKVECSVNGTTVASYDKSTLVTAGKLKSTDGVYGLRFAHDTEVHVSGLTITKN
jgi:hypothetical protein